MFEGTSDLPWSHPAGGRPGCQHIKVAALWLQCDLDDRVTDATHELAPPTLVGLVSLGATWNSLVWDAERTRGVLREFRRVWTSSRGALFRRPVQLRSRRAVFANLRTDTVQSDVRQFRR